MASLPKTKVCNKCGKRRAVSKFYVKDKVTGRLHARCSLCHNKETLAAFYRNADHNRERNRKHAAAKYRNDPQLFCQRSRKWREDNPEKARLIAKKSEAKGKESKREYRKANAAKIKAQSVAYRTRKCEEIKAADARYRQQNRDLIRARHKAWREANKERWKEIAARTKRKNVDTQRACAHRRYAKKKGNGGSFTAAEWRSLKVACGNRCLMCGRPESVVNLHIDHIRPISRGGPSFIWNLQPMCRSCNSLKHTQTLDLRPVRVRHHFRE